MPLSNRQIKALKLGVVYEIEHERKGTFVGKLIAFDDEAARIGDPEDKVYLTFVFDIRVGTAQAHMSKGVKDERGVPLDTRTSNIKPSLITQIRQTDRQEWLLKVKTPRLKKAQQDPSWIDRVLGR